MVVKDVSNLKFRIIKNEDFEKNRELVESAFDLIYERWTVANRALKISEKVSSDSLMFSDVLGLWSGGECIAVVLSRRGHMDGYFAHWSLFCLYGADGVQKIKDRGNNIIVFHRTSVCSKWGKNKTNHHVVKIIFGLMYKYLLNSDCDFSVGLSNNGLGIDDVAYEWGSENIMTKSVYNTTGDILITYKEKFKGHPDPEVNLVVEKLWGEYEKSINTKNRGFKIAVEQNADRA